MVQKPQAILCSPDVQTLFFRFCFVRKDHKMTQIDNCGASVILLSVGHYLTILIFAGVRRLTLSSPQRSHSLSLPLSLPFLSLSLSLTLPLSLSHSPSLKVQSICMVVLHRDLSALEGFEPCVQVLIHYGLPHACVHCAFP